MKSLFLNFMLVILTVTSVVSTEASACGGRRIRCGSPCGGGGHGGGYAYGGRFGVAQGPRGNMFATGAYGRPLLVGAGAVAFRRGNRLHRRSRRSAFFGFYGRANRLAWRGDAAYNRGFYRNGRANYYGMRGVWF